MNASAAGPQLAPSESFCVKLIVPLAACGLVKLPLTSVVVVVE